MTDAVVRSQESGTVTHRTTCPLDCPDTCALDVAVADGVVTRVTAAGDGPITNGFICGKVSSLPRRQYHPDRLRYPQLRVGTKGSGAFSRCSWDEAIAHIAQRLGEIRQKYGGEAILPYHYGGSNGIITDEFLDTAFFARLGASRLAKTICATPTTLVATGMYGKMPGVAFEDYPAADCIVVWGANPKASNIHLVPYLKTAKRNGAFIVTVDPRQNFSDYETDLHLPVRPGSDVGLALGLIRWWKQHDQLDLTFAHEHGRRVNVLLERCEEWPLDRVEQVTGVRAEDVEGLAVRYADAGTAVIRCGWGVERCRNGGQAVAAILAIPGVMGKFGVRGGGYTMSNSGAVRKDGGGSLGIDRWDTRTINMTQLGDVLLGDVSDPPIKGLFVYNCNPAVTVPDQRRVLEGLARDDLFTVVFDQVMTDTAVFADVLLPATTFLEHTDLRIAYGNFAVGGIRPVVPPEGEARPNAEVFAELGRAMGWLDEPFSWDPSTYLARAAARLAVPGRPSADEVFAQGELHRFDFDGAPPVQFETVFPRTEDGKIDFAPPQLGDRPYEYIPPDDRFPLAMISPSTARLVTSTFGEFNLATLEVTMNPRDAEARSIADRDEVRVFNDMAEVRCVARVSERVRTGVVSMPKGAWRKTSRNGMTSTALCPSHVNVVGGAACFNDARVEIERA